MSATVIEFFVPGIPTTKNKRKAFTIKNKAGDVVGARVAHPERDKEKQRAFASVANDHAPPAPWVCPVRLELVFTMPIAGSWSGKKTAMAESGELRHTSRPDTSRLTTFVEDALSGVFYLDDALVVELRAEKRFGHRPGTHVRVSQVEGVRSNAKRGER